MRIGIVLRLPAIRREFRVNRALKMAKFDQYLASQLLAFEDGGGKAECNNSIGGAVKKPLIVVPCRSNTALELHVHLELDADCGSISGWNVKYRPGFSQLGKYYYNDKADRTEVYPRQLTQGERTFLSQKLPNWNAQATWSAYNIPFNTITGGLSAKKRFDLKQAELAAEQEQKRLAEEREKAEALARETRRLQEERERLERANTPHAINHVIGSMSKSQFKKKNETLERWKSLIRPELPAVRVTGLSLSVPQGGRSQEVSVRMIYKNIDEANAHQAQDTATIDRVIKPHLSANV
jgi:hypothetical protein